MWSRKASQKLCRQKPYMQELCSMLSKENVPESVQIKSVQRILN